MSQLKVVISAAVLVCAFSNSGFGASNASKIGPSKIEKIGETGLKRITLTPQAAQRIGLETVNVIEEYVQQNRKIAGIVTELSQTDDAGIVTGVISVNGLQQTGIDCERDVHFVPMFEYDWSKSSPARMSDLILTGSAGNEPVNYVFENTADALLVGTQVFIEICNADTVGQAQVMPHSALLYSADGKSWVYTEESPLTFVRAPVEVAWIDGARVILKSGPAAGIAIVTTGSVELFGEEFGIGH